MTRAVSAVAAVLVLSGLLLLGRDSTTYALAAVVIAAGLLVTSVLGLERMATVVLTIALFTAPLDQVRVGGSVTVSDALLVLGFLALAPILIGHRLHMPATFTIGWLILLLAGLATSLLATDPGLSFNGFGRLTAAVLILPLAFGLWHPSPRVLAQLAGAYVFGQLVSVGDAFVTGQIGDGRYEGLSTHSNYFGLCCLLALSLTPYLIGRAKRWRSRLLWLGLDALMVAGISMSGSRAAILGLGVLVVAIIAVERSAIGGVALMFGCLVLAVSANALIAHSGSGSALSRLSSGNATSQVSDSARAGLLTSGLRDFTAHPVLGHGFADTLVSHDIFLEILVAGGLIGLAGYLLVISSFLRPLVERVGLYRLSYPVLSYLVVGVLSNSLWDRFIWTALSLTVAGMHHRAHGPSATGTESGAEPSAASGRTPVRLASVGPGPRGASSGA